MTFQLRHSCVRRPDAPDTLFYGVAINGSISTQLSLNSSDNQYAFLDAAGHPHGSCSQNALTEELSGRRDLCLKWLDDFASRNSWTSKPLKNCLPRHPTQSFKLLTNIRSKVSPQVTLLTSVSPNGSLFVRCAASGFFPNTITLQLVGTTPLCTRDPSESLPLLDGTFSTPLCNVVIREHRPQRYECRALHENVTILVRTGPFSSSNVTVATTLCILLPAITLALLFLAIRWRRPWCLKMYALVNVPHQ